MAPTLPVEFAGQRVSRKLSQNNSTQMMGKTRKVSKGYSHGFVPDYRHAVDTTANSEGFGTSGRIDTEITASEDSCAVNMKSLALNPDSSQQFGVPIQVVSLSKLSSFERKELETRLKHELEKVRKLQKNIGMMTSPSDIHSCSATATQRRPMPEFARSMSLPMSKKKMPPGRNGRPRSKKTGSVSGSARVAVPPTSATGNPMLMKQCETLLNKLMVHNFGWVFNTPVDAIALKIPDYYTVIQHPMDLGTVKTKLMSGEYKDPWCFAGDVRLTFSNAMTYNPRGNDVHIMAETLSKFFEVKWKPIEKKLDAVMVVPVRQTETEPMLPPLKKKKTLSNEIKQKEEEAVVVKRRIMSDAEKLKLRSELESSSNDLPERIIDFLKENSSSGNGNKDDEIEIEIDIDTLDDDTLFKLRKLLDDFFAEKQKNTLKDLNCETEIHNESGFSNSSMQPSKDNDVHEEDVDIGVDEVPISNFPPVEIEIEKDTIVRNNKAASSSSSSSASGSSSSDSDSGSSSDSDSDDAKASTIVNNVKDTKCSEVNNEDQKSNCGEVERRQEGESGSCPSERQVSPDKLYRAAILRSRFADTILKAQEKTTGKVEEQDRERLRLEKEEVEKRRKQEMVRLQAEAKAAEEARRNAELEAAAEAKKKRELEREAARQALQKMEKMVDINDNSGFLEDLEMLTVAPAQPLESLIDETSVDPFNFDGKRNPLEQLGLYMKDDEEEEEEEEEVDPEEGEID